ncbi:MAG: hypothetical protein AYL33_007010, partial [Candidatus Bathyarchaeota archaeon B63]
MLTQAINTVNKEKINHKHKEEKREMEKRILTGTLTIILLASMILAVIPAQATTSGTIDVEPVYVTPGVILKIELALTVTGDTFDVYVSKNGYASIAGDLKIFSGLSKAQAGTTLYWMVPTTGDYSLTGDYWIKATDDFGATVVVSNKYTVGAVPTVTIDPASGTLPKTVTISGAGFVKSATRQLEVYWDKYDPTNRIYGPADVTTDADGKFTGVTFSITAMPKGARSILVYLYEGDTASPGDAQYGAVTTFTVEPLATVAEASVAADTAGTTITLSGVGFTPGEIAKDTVTVTVRDIITGATLKTSATTHDKITVGADGSFGPVTVTITEALPMGTVDVTVQDYTLIDAFLSSKIGDAGEFIVKVGASSGNVGDTVSFLGIGFGGTGANSIELRFYDPITGLPTVIKKFTPDGNGAVKDTFTVPDLAKAVYTMKVVDNNKPFEKAPSPQSYEVIPKLTITPTTAAVGDTLTIEGTGFPYPYEAEKIYIGGVEHTFTKTASLANGKWGPLSFTLKDVSGGGLALNVELTGIPIVKLKVIPTLPVITPAAEANIGDLVYLGGKGWLAGESVTISFIKDTTVVATGVITLGGTAASDGKLGVWFMMPTGLTPGETYKVVVAGTTETNKVEISYKAKALGDTKIYLNRQPDNTQVTKGYVGDPLVIIGTGTTDAKETVYWDGTAIATDIPVTKGYFTTTITIPETTHGAHTVEYSPSATFTVYAEIKLSLTQGYYGNVTTISGTGFPAGDTITIKWQGIPLKTVTADSKGSFTTTITVPTSSPGLYRIDAEPTLFTPTTDDV